MHEQSIIDTILANIDYTDCTVKKISLVCNEKYLRDRLEKDVAVGLRKSDVIERSVSRFPFYRKLSTVKIDTSMKTVEEIVHEIIQL